MNEYLNPWYIWQKPEPETPYYGCITGIVINRILLDGLVKLG